MTLFPLLMLLCATPVPAQDWSASFPASEVASQLDLDSVKVLVAAANPDAREATRAIEAALRASGKTQLVMDDSGLGDLANLSDLQIVERCQGLPVDRVMVVRVFPSEGGPSSAVTSIYDLRGVRKAGFSAVAGEPLEARVKLKTPPPGTEGKTAKELYDEKFIGFADIQIFDNTSGDVLHRWIAPYQGKYHKPMEDLRFYEVVGRTDLITAYKKRSNVRLGIGLGGAGMILGGGGLVAWGLAGSCTKIDVANNLCLARDMRPVVAGGIVAGVGLLAVLATGLINPNPVDGPTEREIADTYNKRLQRELGLQESSQLQAPTSMSLASAELSFEF